MTQKQSLASLTSAFIKILTDANGADVELSAAEQLLKTTTRRLYDVVNVLAGVGLLTRTAKSRVRWVSTGDESQQSAASSLLERERNLDGLLAKVESDLLEVSNSELFQRFGWIDVNDAMMCSPGDEVTLYWLKGPPTMSITIDPDGTDSEGGHTIVCVVEDPSDGPIELAPIGAKVV
jgi:transcription factor E2F3